MLNIINCVYAQYRLQFSHVIHVCVWGGDHSSLINKPHKLKKQLNTLKIRDMALRFTKIQVLIAAAKQNVNV